MSVLKGFSQPRATGTDRTVLPDTSLMPERKLLGDMTAIKSLKQSGLSGVFTGQAVSAAHPPAPLPPLYPGADAASPPAEQDGGAAHGGGQPGRHRLPGAHARRARTPHRRVEEAGDGAAAAGPAAGRGGPEEEGNSSCT